MTDEGVEQPSDQSTDVWMKPARVDERTVDAPVWETWAASARDSSEKGFLWGATAALGVGLISAGIGLLVLLPSPAAMGVLIYAPLVGWAAWSLASTRVRRRQFVSTAEAMKDVMVPALVRTPSDDELHTLAATRHALFINDSTVCRAEDRVNLYAIRVSEYPLDQVPAWIVAGAGTPGGGGDGGGGGC